MSAAAPEATPGQRRIAVVGAGWAGLAAAVHLVQAGAQVQVGPPTFALFTTGFLEAGYRRFIERRLREEFGFEGTPIRIVMRVREKRSRRR